MNKATHLFFDLDGTLIDSAPDLALAVNLTLEQLDRPSFEESIIRSWVGNGAKVLIERALSGSSQIDHTLDQDLAEQALAIFLSLYQQHLCVKSQLYPRVKETLQALKDKGICLALITNKPERFIQELLQGLGIDHFFSLCLGGDSLAEKKPSALPLLHTCQTLGVHKDRCIMIGDSKNDILAAQAASMRSIALSYGYNYDEDISVYAPDWVCDDFSEILNILQ